MHISYPFLFLPRTMWSNFSIEKKIMSGWGGGAFEIFTDNGEILNVGEVWLNLMEGCWQQRVNSTKHWHATYSLYIFSLCLKALCIIFNLYLKSSSRKLLVKSCRSAWSDKRTFWENTLGRSFDKDIFVMCFIWFLKLMANICRL